MTSPPVPEPVDSIENPPGLAQVRYAHGRYAPLRERMLDAIARDTRYLRELNSRDPADPSMALIDSWAVAGEVLGFYAERIANESWLQTATERRSLRALARLIDYELRPGKAAETWLAFTLENAPGAPLEVPIPVGTRVQSIPGPGETMVTFETVEAITGRPQLSAMRPRMDRPQTLEDVKAAGAALCRGVLNDVRRGDWLLLVDDGGARELFRVEKVLADPPTATTRVDIVTQPVRPIISLPDIEAVIPFPGVFASPKLEPALVAGEITGKVRSQVAFESGLRAARIDMHKLRLHLDVLRLQPPPLPASQGLFHFRSRAAIFSHNVPNEAAGTATQSPLPKTVGTACRGRTLALDAEYPELRRDGWIAFSRLRGTPFVTRIVAVDTVSECYGKLSGRVTQVELEPGFPEGWASLSVAEVTVALDSRELALAMLPVTDAVSGSTLRLDSYVPGLAPGRPVVVTGERADLPGVVESEVHVVDDVQLDDGHSVLLLKTSIAGPFRRASVTANANVALATHGESGSQPIGHGDASAKGQSFRLPIVPLTHVGASNAKGLAAALAIRVDGILWSEIASLRDAGPLDRVYQLRYGEDGSVWVRFGDGMNGRRLPSGTNNVVAYWRKGLGREGMVRGGQLSLPSGAPQGVKAITNPRPATGAADGETLEEARANAPLSVMTLDRIVTLRDYEDFARAFGGIAKAQASWCWNGASRAVVLTVAGVEGDVPAERDLDYLRAAIARFSDSAVSHTILPYRPATFRVVATLRIDPMHVPDTVRAAVAGALAAAFSFESRSLGQPVYRSEVISVMQAVPGVDWLDLNAFYRGDTPSLAEALSADAPRSGLRLRLGAQPVAAELLSIHSTATELTVMP